MERNKNCEYNTSYEANPHHLFRKQKGKCSKFDWTMEPLDLQKRLMSRSEKNTKNPSTFQYGVKKEEINFQNCQDKHLTNDTLTKNEKETKVFEKGDLAIKHTTHDNSSPENFKLDEEIKSPYKQEDITSRKVNTETVTYEDSHESSNQLFQMNN